MIQLGKKAKDKITGFEGIVTGMATYLTGCDQYCLAPVAKENDIKDARWFDDGRLDVVGEGVSVESVAAKSGKGGADIAAPAK